MRVAVALRVRVRVCDAVGDAVRESKASGERVAAPLGVDAAEPLGETVATGVAAAEPLGETVVAEVAAAEPLGESGSGDGEGGV